MNETESYIQSKKDEMIGCLRELVAIPSVMGEASDGAPFGEQPKRALLKMAEFCEKSGFVVTNYENAVISADLYPEKGIELGILCHLDVVPANKDSWDTDPFELAEKNGVLYGRGVIDDKGPAVAVLYALKCAKELGFKLKKGVRLIFGTNEENGSNDLEIYKKHDKFPPKVFTPDGSFPVINIEKGMMRSTFSGKISKNSKLVGFSGGKIPNAVADKASAVLRGVAIENALSAISADKSGAEFHAEERGGLLNISCKGKSAHASTPETGINAVTALISLINKLCDEPALKGLEHILPFGETNGKAMDLECSDESGALTCVFSIFEADGENCTGTIDVRFPVSKNLAFIEDKERKALSSAGLSFEGFLGDEPHVVSENSEFVRKLLEVYERCEGEKGKCVAIGGGTYVHDIEGGVAFGAERGDTDYHMHGDNEFITADELIKDAVLFAEAIKHINS